MSRHAYLIIAYAQPLMLQRLIEAIDDERNDIFVHIDKKASFDGSNLHASHSSLFTIPRTDARWGDYSLVKVELLLIEAALQHGPYSYLHLLSDSDYPIKSQDYIHATCQRLAGREFIGFSKASPKELERKVQRHHLFPEDFRNQHFFKHVLRTFFLKTQEAVGYKRNRRVTFMKGPQWWSVTSAFAQYVLRQKAVLLKTYHHTFCPDEIFVQTLCWSSPFKDSVDNTRDEFIGCRRYIKWAENKITPFTEDDILLMKSSLCWFARKFGDEQNNYIVDTFNKLNKTP